MSHDPQPPRRIVLATWGSFGDLHPYMALALELGRRGHVPVIASIPLYREKVEAAGLRFHPVGPDLPLPGDNPELVRKVIDRRRGAEFMFGELLGPHMRETYADTLGAVTAGGGADLVVSHPLSLTVPLIAERTGIAWVSTVLSPISFFSVHDPPTLPILSPMRALAALHPAVAGAFTAIGRRMTMPWVAPLARLRGELGLPPGRHPLFEGQHAPGRVLALFSPVFGPPQPDFPPNTTVTGFPFYDAPERPPDPDLQAFLDSGPAPVVFTLGSSAVWAAGDFYRTAAAAVSALGCRAILLDGGAGGRPSGLPPDVRAFDYAPYGRLFGRARAVVHQGGVGTTAQALRAGRPQLVMPFGHDTLDNARRVVGLGTGLTLPRARFTPARLARALGRILGGEFDERASVLGARIRSEDGVGAAVDCLLERALIESRDRTPEAS